MKRSKSSDRIYNPKKYRVLSLQGEMGTVFCRIHDPKTYSTFPRFSQAGNLECATRSFLRMKNLVVVRRNDRTTSMIGPGDYFGNIEKPHKKGITIDIKDGFPTIVQHPLEEAIWQSSQSLRKLASDEILSVKARWISGKDRAAICKKKQKYMEKTGENPFGDSLFPNPGILEIDEDDLAFDLPEFDAREVDLSDFKVRLLQNDIPFQLTHEKLHSSDDYRPVSYDFCPNYAQACVEDGQGLFLETHPFLQTMTPMDEAASGFITLGKWNEDKTRLDLIAVNIPFGYTLVVEKNSIHGDSTFKGMYMMSMTSNHVTMSAADVVFLKHKQSKKNISLKADFSDTLSEPTQLLAPKPFVLYNYPTKKELSTFHKLTKGCNLILQPTAVNTWRATLYRRLGINLSNNSDDMRSYSYDQYPTGNKLKA